jgi:predicted nuclease of restriction endonuclease-like (RecB) superfamily
MSTEFEIYKALLQDIKLRIRQGQIKALQSANAEMLGTYWDIGKMIHEQQQLKGWGSGVIPKLAAGLKNELADEKGYSVRNIQIMIQFYQQYPSLSALNQSPEAIAQLSVSQLEKGKETNTQLAVAQLDYPKIDAKVFLSVGWTQHTILIQKIKDLPTRYWYMQQIVTQGWSRDTLVAQIKSNAHQRQGALAHNFTATLPANQALLATQTFKDPYLFDFVTLATQYTENELELELVKHVQQFLIELGAGFAFVGRQYKITVSDKDFYIDLLFYHLTMRCFVVVELKNGDFIPEYAGKINFYCSTIDDQIKHTTDAPTIGLILCKGKDKLFAEYALRDINKPIGISEYELTQMLPDNLKSSLPSIEDIENEFLNR